MELKRKNGEIIGTGDSLVDLLLNHKKNLRGANLRGANLRGANLSGANLSGAILHGADLAWVDLENLIGNGEEIITTQTDKWLVARTADVMQIGCESHPIELWWTFTDNQISEMDRGALAWWRQWKPVLQKMIEIAPARPTTAQEGSDNE